MYCAVYCMFCLSWQSFQWPVTLSSRCSWNICRALTVQQIGIVQLCPQHVCKIDRGEVQVSGLLYAQTNSVENTGHKRRWEGPDLTSQVVVLSLSSQSFCINQLNKSTGARTGGLGHLLTFISYRLESCFRQWHVVSVRGDRHLGRKFLTRLKNFTFICEHDLFAS